MTDPLDEYRDTYYGEPTPDPEDDALPEVSDLLFVVGVIMLLPIVLVGWVLNMFSRDYWTER